MLTMTQKSDVREAMLLYIDKNHLSLSTVSKELGVNAAYVNRIANGHYMMPVGKGRESAIGDDVFRKLATYINHPLEREYNKRVATQQSVCVEHFLASAKEHATIKTIIGETGIGKTYTIDHFVAQNRHNCVYKITVGNLHTVADVVDDLLEVFGLTLDVKSKVKKLRAIEKIITQMCMSGKHPLLVIDEAENVKLPILGLLKQIYDTFKGKCGIVLVGTNQLMEKVEKMRARNKVGAAQFARRIKAGVEWVKSCDWWEDEEYMRYVQNECRDKRIVSLLKDIASNYGEVNDYVEPAMRDAERLGVEFNYDFFVMKYRLNIA